jgi:hypothetical protein
MALTSPDSRCRVSDPAKHAFSLSADDVDDDVAGVYVEELNFKLYSGKLAQLFTKTEPAEVEGPEHFEVR